MLFLPEQNGQGLIEYALLLLLIALIVITVVALFGITLGGVFSKINRCLFEGGPSCF